MDKKKNRTENVIGVADEPTEMLIKKSPNGYCISFGLIFGSIIGILVSVVFSVSFLWCLAFGSLVGLFLGCLLYFFT